MSAKRKKEVLVIVHDAGGAEVIGTYVKLNLKRERFIAYGAGPAIKIFARLNLPLQPIGESVTKLREKLERHMGAQYAIIGTGWMTVTERNALKVAKEFGIKTVVYLDSWEKYPSRFGYPERGWRRNLPDELWVGDSIARTLAKKHFPKTPTRLVPNQYVMGFKARYRARRKRVTGECILFFDTVGEGSRTALAEILEILSKSNERRSVLIRPHPSEKRSTYDDLVREYRSAVQIEISHEADIVSDMILASAVVGCETMPLVLSWMVGIPTIRIVPTGTKPFLPFPEIRRVASGRAAARHLITGADAHTGSV